MKDSAVLERTNTHPDQEMHRHQQAAVRVSDAVHQMLEQLPPADVEELAVRMEQVLNVPAQPQRKVSLIRALAGRDYSEEERLQIEQLSLLDHFRRRRELLRGSLTTAQVAEILGTSRQTPHDRVKNGSLLAVADHGALRFPPWQFDPESESGVVTGLPEVARNLRVSPLGKIRWLIKPNSFLDNGTPLESLKSGQVERVVALARGVART